MYNTSIRIYYKNNTEFMEFTRATHKVSFIYRNTRPKEASKKATKYLIIEIYGSMGTLHDIMNRINKIAGDITKITVDGYTILENGKDFFYDMFVTDFTSRELEERDLKLEVTSPNMKLVFNGMEHYESGEFTVELEEESSSGEEGHGESDV